MKKNFFIGLLLTLAFSLHAQVYEEMFPAQFEKANTLRQQFSQKLVEEGIENPDFYMAIVFPEMMRYSQTRDVFEQVINKITYTNIYGYEGCSIGPFQMKPFFAERVEDYIQQYEELKEKYTHLIFTGSKRDFSVRYNRIVRLQDTDYQIEYLKAFVDVCIKHFNLENETVESKLKIISTAYNAGIFEKKEYYNHFYELKAFPGKSSETGWNYSELSLHYYQLFSTF